MLKLSDDQIDSVRYSSGLGVSVTSRLENPSIISKRISELTQDEWTCIHDASNDALINDAPLVKEFSAAQDKGIYKIGIYGVPDAYFVTATEFDIEGVFLTLEEACSYVYSQHGEFMVSMSTEIEDITAPNEDQDDAVNENIDALVSVVLGNVAPIVARLMKERILSDVRLCRLANGCGVDTGFTSDVSLKDAYDLFKQKLPQPTSFCAGMAQHMRLSKLAARMLLYHLITGRLPNKKNISALYSL